MLTVTAWIAPPRNAVYCHRCRLKHARASATRSCNPVMPTAIYVCRACRESELCWRVLPSARGTDAVTVALGDDDNPREPSAQQVDHMGPGGSRGRDTAGQKEGCGTGGEVFFLFEENRQ